MSEMTMDYVGESPEYESSYEMEAEPAEANPWQEYIEARRPAPSVRTAPRRSAYTPRPSGTGSYVTQAQLQGALARVSQQIGVNSTAIKTLDGRVRGVVTEQSRAGAAVRKEITDRKKDNDALRRDLQSTRELSALIPLVTSGSSSTLAGLAPLAFLLPPDALSGGSSGSGGTASSMLGGNGIVAVIAIAAAMHLL